MKHFIIGAVFCAFVTAGAFAAEESKDVKVEGILIDRMCGKRMLQRDDPQDAAAKHAKACVIKCADSGFAIMSKGKLVNLSDESAEKALAYLKKDDTTTAVAIDGKKNEDGEIEVTSISKPKKKDDEAAS